MVTSEGGNFSGMLATPCKGTLRGLRGSRRLLLPGTLGSTADQRAQGVGVAVPVSLGGGGAAVYWSMPFGLLRHQAFNMVLDRSWFKAACRVARSSPANSAQAHIFSICRALSTRSFRARCAALSALAPVIGPCGQDRDAMTIPVRLGKIAEAVRQGIIANWVNGTETPITPVVNNAGRATPCARTLLTGADLRCRTFMRL
jgi:hypothetical protein